MSGVPAVLDHATGKGGLGLYMSVGDVSCWRHNSHDPRAAGIWEVCAHLSHAAALVNATDQLVSRPAVVDDFGNLVFVGWPL